MADLLPERSVPFNVPAFGVKPDLSNVQTAFAEADYQLELLHLLQQKAKRNERLGNRIAIASFIVAIGTGFAAMSVQFFGWQIVSVPKSELELAQVLAVIIGLLATIIVFRVQVARDRQQLLHVEVKRLASAIDAARLEVERRDGASGTAH